MSKPLEKRVRDLTRIVEIKNHQRRSIEWELASLAWEENKALEDQRTTLAALNGDQPLHGMFTDMMARRLRSIAERLERVRVARALKQPLLVAKTRQLKYAEGALEEAESRAARATWEKELAELLELTVASKRASFPKA